MAKLTAEIVRKIRGEYAAGGVSQAALGRKFGIADSAVCLIVKRVYWAHVE